MIFIRDDDVLMPYRAKQYPDPFERFKQIHEWLKASPRFMHRPALLYWELQQYPKCIEYIQRETDLGNMEPQLHGLSHCDYTIMQRERQLAAHKWCKDWFSKLGLPQPKYFYAPWGYLNDTVVECAKIRGLEAVGIKDAIRLKYVMRSLRDGRSKLEDYEDKEIYWHWWSGGDRIKRLVEYA